MYKKNDISMFFKIFGLDNVKMIKEFNSKIRLSKNKIRISIYLLFIIINFKFLFFFNEILIFQVA